MYKYELHCHTDVSSKCAKVSPCDLVDFYKNAGYTGIVVTDHFLNGNTTVSKYLPWEEQIELYVQGYRQAKKRGDEVGLDVFFGIESSYEGCDFLVYGIDEKALLKLRYCDKLPVREFLRLMRANGGYVIHAHPFREARYIPYIKLLPRDVDGIETANANRTPFENKMALEYAKNYELPMFCGSDNHGKNTEFCCTVLNFKAKNVKEIIEAGIRGEIENLCFALDDIKKD